MCIRDRYAGINVNSSILKSMAIAGMIAAIAGAIQVMGYLLYTSYNVGRDKDIITNIKTKVSLKRGNKEIIPIVSYYNISKIDELIKQLNEQFYISPVNACLLYTSKNITTQQLIMLLWVEK